MNERIARLPVKRLTVLLKESYVQYDKATVWRLPKECEKLYLDLGSNLLRNVVGNLSWALKSSENLRDINLSLQDNGMSKGEIHVLVKNLS